MEDDVLLLLRLEHRNQARLLNLLEQQIDEAKHGRAVNAEIVQGIADYFLGYPDLCHHPKEDALFRRLRERDPVAAEAFADLLVQHEDLTALTERLSGVVRKLTLEGFAQQGRFTEFAEGYVKVLRRHMQSEEEGFFPAIERSFTPTDWAEVDFQVFDQTDPLFSQTVERRFEALRDQINEANAARRNS